MATQSMREQWLALRWNHYYQWKNLLDKEREDRQHLEQHYQQQLRQISLLGKRSEAALLIRDQAVELAKWRQQQQQKRAHLQERQVQQLGSLQQQLAQSG